MGEDGAVLFFCRHHGNIPRNLFSHGALRYRKHLCRRCVSSMSKTAYMKEPLTYITSEIRKKCDQTLSRHRIARVIAAHGNRCFVSGADGGSMTLILIRTSLWGSNDCPDEVQLVPCVRSVARKNGYRLPDRFNEKLWASVEGGAPISAAAREGAPLLAQALVPAARDTNNNNKTSLHERLLAACSRAKQR